MINEQHMLYGFTLSLNHFKGGFFMFCKQCGKPIDDGQELCEDCQAKAGIGNNQDVNSNNFQGNNEQPNNMNQNYNNQNYNNGNYNIHLIKFTELFL